jgi:hypothetical protein
MKGIVYILLMLLTLNVSAQTNNTRSLRIANGETAFGRRISKGDKIVDLATSNIYLVTGNIEKSSNINNSNNLILLNPWNQDLGLIYPKSGSFHFGLQNHQEVSVDSISNTVVYSNNTLVTASGIYDFVTGMVDNETTKKVFSLELEEMQTLINIGFSLSATSSITLNGISLKPYQWEGEGTNIFLKLNVKQYDYLIIKN